jgi:eukaryotic-like serine/threonine-protein kinase
MRSQLSMRILVVVCAVALGGIRGPSAQAPLGAGAFGIPSQITSQSGQELFPTLAPDGTFAYSRMDGPDWDIFVQRRNVAPVNVTADSPSNDWQAEFSPDGKWLAFRSERDGGGIYLMDPNGGSVQRLSAEGFNPSWSPDGTEIAYSSAQVIADPSSRPVRGTLSAIKVATGERRVVYDLGDAVQPRWSPDGERIAFWAFAPQGGQRDLWTIPAAGGKPVAVIQDAATDWNPVWSPDGRYLYFASDRDGSMEIWRIGIDERTGLMQSPPEPLTTGGTGTRGHITIADNGGRLLFVDQTSRHVVESVGFDPGGGKVVGHPEVVLDPSLKPTNVEVSPDGQWLAFYSVGRPHASPGGLWEDLYVSRRDGTERRQITSDSARDRGPAWSPDGRKIAFFSDRSGSYEIWTINPDGTNLRQLTHGYENRSGVLWSPDGSRLHYVQRRGLTWDAYVIDPTKLPAQQVVEELSGIGTSNEYFTATSWSPDGQKLAGTRGFVDRAVPGGIFVYTFATKKFDLIVDGVAGAPRWLNDSRRLLYSDETLNKIFVVDTQTQRRLEVLSVAPRILGPTRLTRNNTTLYFHAADTASDIWQLNLAVAP